VSKPLDFTQSANDLIAEYDLGQELTDRILSIAADGYKAGYERGRADATTETRPNWLADDPEKIIAQMSCSDVVAALRETNQPKNMMTLYENTTEENQRKALLNLWPSMKNEAQARTTITNGTTIVHANALLHSLTAENCQLSADLARVTAERAELLAIAGRNVCRHETRHRGGILWTICADCGHHWADDKGGFEQGPDAKRLEEIEGKL